MNQANKQATKVALVTGAARRIGAAIVQRLHQEGFCVLIHCNKSLAEAKFLAQSLNQVRKDSAFVLQQELKAPDAAERLIEAALVCAGRLDLLVNNASLFERTSFDKFDSKIWDELFQINLQIPFQLSLNARPHLAKREGLIINLSDIHADTPLKDYAVYCQSKAALNLQTKALAREFAPEVRVNALAPGAISWPENENSLSAEQQHKIIAKTPLKRHGDPLFIAEAVMAFVNNLFLTGQILKVDGGRSI